MNRYLLLQKDHTTKCDFYEGCGFLIVKKDITLDEAQEYIDKSEFPSSDFMIVHDQSGQYAECTCEECVYGKNNGSPTSWYIECTRLQLLRTFKQSSDFCKFAKKRKGGK